MYEINNIKIDCFIPVRSNSKRLKKKHLRPICGKPALQRAIDALNKCERIDNIFLCLSDNEEYQTWQHIHCHKLKIPIEEENVCQRLAYAASIMGSHIAILWSGDCFICNIDILELMIKNCIATGKTIISNMEGAIVSPIRHWQQEIMRPKEYLCDQFPMLLADKERTYKLDIGKKDKISVDTLDELINIRQQIKDSHE